MKVLAVVSVLLLCTALGFSQRLRCSQLRRTANEEGKLLFRNAAEVPNMERLLCLNNRNRVRALYSCAEGFTTVLSGQTEDAANTSPIFDLNRGDIVVVCVPDPTDPPSVEPSEEGVEEVPSLPSCPSSPTQLSQYLPRDQEKVCLFQCEFNIGVFGRRAGRPRTREVYRCCYGEPKQFSRALKVYTCPDAPPEVSNSVA